MKQLAAALIFASLALSACGPSGYRGGYGGGYGYGGSGDYYPDHYNNYGIRQGYGNGSAD